MLKSSSYFDSFLFTPFSRFSFTLNTMSKIASLQYAGLAVLCLLGLSMPAMAQTSAFDDPGAHVAAGGSGDFHAVNDKITGDVALGAASQIVVLLRNDDTKPVTAGTINLYPSSNISAAVGENQCAGNPIAPGEICAISVQIKGLQQGNYRIEMLIRHDGKSKLLTTTLSGNVQSSGDTSKDLVSDIEAIPATIDFGSLNDSRSQVKSIVLRNITSKPIDITDISVDAGSQSGFSIKQNCGKLQTGEACVAAVTWAPEQRGPSSGIVVVRHTGATGVATVEIKGQYTPSDADAAKVFPQAVPGKGLLVSSQEAVDFGSGVAQTSSVTVSLVNVGDVPLTLQGMHTSGENGVSIEGKGCKKGMVLQPIEACPLTLTWNPLREGNIVDDVQITHSGARGVLVLPIRGNATRAVNKNTKPINAADSEASFLKNITPMSASDFGGDDEYIEGHSVAKGSKSGKKGRDVSAAAAPVAPEVHNALEGYTITSFSSKRAIVSGPGGTRVVFDNDQTVIGGVLWQVEMRPNAIQFSNGDQKILLLFDTSLSSVNPSGAESVTATGGGFAGGIVSPVSAPSAPSTPAPVPSSGTQ